MFPLATKRSLITVALVIVILSVLQVVAISIESPSGGSGESDSLARGLLNFLFSVVFFLMYLVIYSPFALIFSILLIASARTLVKKQVPTFLGLCVAALLGVCLAGFFAWLMYRDSNLGSYWTPVMNVKFVHLLTMLGGGLLAGILIFFFHKQELNESVLPSNS